jgi:plasmid maintenance system antidote protein VapI
MRTYTKGEIRKFLREQTTPPRGETQKQAAKALGFSPQFINDVLGNRRGLTDALADSLGFRRVSYFVKKKPEDVNGNPE